MSTIVGILKTHLWVFVYDARTFILNRYFLEIIKALYTLTVSISLCLNKFKIIILRIFFKGNK
jgi:hypothetical protein